MRPVKGKLVPRMGNKVAVLSKIFANPDVPALDDSMSHLIITTAHLKNAKEGEHGANCASTVI
ncbi:hypothetical protein ACLK1S_07575 [Escherichia coli]